MTSTTALSPTLRSTVRRLKDRARTDREDLYAVLDAGLICHLAVVINGAPVVLPTCYGRDGDTLYLHGSTGARSLLTASGGDVSVTVTLVDGLVYARAVMHFSANYRSAVVHGRPREVEGDERSHGLRVIVEHMTPGSWDYAREPNKKEMAATKVIALSLTESSVKVRTGPPGDDAEDVATGGVWAGVIPLQQHWGRAIPAPDLDDDVAMPAHVRDRQLTTPGS
jgi:uncharacterized protein